MITQDERDTAMRCVDCPSCGAIAGSGCVNFHGSYAPTHKRRVDKYYIDTYGPESEAAKTLNAGN